MLETFIYHMLTTQAPASVAAAVGERVYPAVLPRDVSYPAIRYAAISLPSGERTSTGAQHTTKTAQFQLDVYAKTYLQAATIANALNSHFDGVSGTHSGYVIQLVEVTNQRPSYESNLEIQSQMLELTITYRRV